MYLSYAQQHNFARGAQLNRALVPLTTDQLHARAPSIFATEANPNKTSDKYLFIPTIEFCKALESQGYLPSKVSQSRSKTPGGHEYAKHLIRFRHESNFDNQPIVGDSIPELVLVNSHDGASSFQLSMGLYRLVCSNGLMVGDSVETRRISHQKYNKDSVLEATYTVLKDAEVLPAKVEALKEITLTEPDRMALAQAALSYRYPLESQTKPRPEQILQARRYGDDQTNLWATFNNIQENMMRGGLRTIARNPDKPFERPRRNSTRAVNSVSEEVRLNKVLWNLAEHFAHHKTNDSLFTKMQASDPAHA